MFSFLRPSTVAAIAVACLIPGQGQAEPLKWAPPALVRPVTVAIPPGDVSVHVPGGRDCVLAWPPGRHVGHVQVSGCHNLVSIGGWNTIPEGPDHTNAALNRILELSAITGTAHIEGLLGDASGGGMSDCIDINAPAAVVQIENVRCDGIFGFFDQFHADCIQPFGGVKALRIYDFTCRTAYQGLSVWPVAASPAGWSLDLERVNIVSIGPAIHGAHNSGGYLYWPCAEPSCARVASTRLSEVYLQPRPGAAFATAVYSLAQTALARPAALSAAGAVISFPGLPIDGHVSLGAPPEGDFVPEGRAGPGYQSPGYAAQAGEAAR